MTNFEFNNKQTQQPIKVKIRNLTTGMESVCEITFIEEKAAEADVLLHKEPFNEHVSENGDKLCVGGEAEKIGTDDKFCRGELRRNRNPYAEIYVSAQSFNEGRGHYDVAEVKYNKEKLCVDDLIVSSVNGKIVRVVSLSADGLFFVGDCVRSVK